MLFYYVAIAVALIGGYIVAAVYYSGKIKRSNRSWREMIAKDEVRHAETITSLIREKEQLSKSYADVSEAYNKLSNKLKAKLQLMEALEEQLEKYKPKQCKKCGALIKREGGECKHCGTIN